MPDVRPLALVVDDMRNARDLRIELLEQHGFDAIGASSKTEAERHLRVYPFIDLLVTDVNLDNSIPNDKSGIELAERVQELRPDMPLIGYSGRFEGGELPNDDLRYFKSVHLRGNEDLTKLTTEIEDWHRMALIYREERTQRPAFELTKLRNKYKIDNYDYQLLKELTDPLPDSQSAEGLLRSAGYKLKLIDKGDMPDDLASKGVTIVTPVPVWIQTVQDGLIAEVFKHSELYASGETETEAITYLLYLMEGYYQGMKDADQSEDAPNILELRNYLVEVFG